MSTPRVGFGFDTHRFSDDPARKLVLGGVAIDGARGLVGHSDADLVCHAVTDALLGAAGLGDIGQHFPDTDAKWKNADSVTMLSHAVHLLNTEGWKVGNVDCTIVTEQPKIAPHREAMQTRLAQTVDAFVSVKASRAEGLGAIGRIEGAACWAVAVIEQSTDEERAKP